MSTLNHDTLVKWFAKRPLADMSPSTLRRYCVARWADRCTGIKLGRIDVNTAPTEVEQAGCYLLTDEPLAPLPPVQQDSPPDYWDRVRFLIERATAEA